MTTPSIPDVLAASAVFAGLDPADLERLASHSRIERYDAGALLAREDDGADRFFVVEAGRLAIEIHAPGRPLGVDTAGPGEVVGWSWLFVPHRWTADVRAVETTRVVTIDGHRVRDACDHDPAFGYRIVRCFTRVMTERIASMRLRLLDLYGGRRAG